MDTNEGFALCAFVFTIMQETFYECQDRFDNMRLDSEIMFRFFLFGCFLINFLYLYYSALQNYPEVY